jgi:hypothetical protein
MTEGLIAELVEYASDVRWHELAQGAEFTLIDRQMLQELRRLAIGAEAALCAQQAGEPVPCFECGGTEYADRVCVFCNDITDRALKRSITLAIPAPDASPASSPGILDNCSAPSPAPDAGGGESWPTEAMVQTAAEAHREHRKRAGFDTTGGWEGEYVNAMRAALAAEARIKELETDLATERSRQDGMYPLAETNWRQNVEARDARIKELEGELAAEKADAVRHHHEVMDYAQEHINARVAAEAKVSRLQAALRKLEAIEHRVCAGCGTSHPDSDFPPPGPPYSCCPERKMLTAKEWAKRAERAEAALRVKDEALEPFAAMAEALANWEGGDTEAVLSRLLKTERSRSGFRMHTYARLTAGDFCRAALARGGRDG